MESITLSGWSLLNLTVVTEGDLQRLLRQLVARGQGGRCLVLAARYEVALTPPQAREVARALHWFRPGGIDIETSGPLYNLGPLSLNRSHEQSQVRVS